MRNRWVVIVLAFLGCVIAGAAAAQDTGGTLAGRTVDAQGLPLPGVAVTVTGAQGAEDGGQRRRTAASSRSVPDAGLVLSARGASGLRAGRSAGHPGAGDSVSGSTCR